MQAGISLDCQGYPIISRNILWRKEWPRGMCYSQLFCRNPAILAVWSCVDWEEIMHHICGADTRWSVRRTHRHDQWADRSHSCLGGGGLKKFTHRVLGACDSASVMGIHSNIQIAQLSGSYFSQVSTPVALIHQTSSASTKHDLVSYVNVQDCR